MISSKQIAEHEKKVFDVQQHNARIYFQIYQKKLSVRGIDKAPTEYDIQKHNYLYKAIRELSREKMSVDIIQDLLSKILVISDIQRVEDPEVTFDILTEKFKFCSDLAKSCKLSVKELLKYSSKKVYTNIVRMLIINPECLKLIQRFIGIDFFKNHILPRTWYYLIKNSEIDSKTIENIILKLKVNGEHFISLQELKQSLHYCVSQIAWQKNITEKQKRTLLQNVKSIFRINNNHDFNELFKSQIEIFTETGQRKNSFFESEVIINIIDKLGMSKKYLMEYTLSQRDNQRLLVYYSKNQYLQSEFFQRQMKADGTDLYKVIMDAFMFISSEFKMKNKIEHSDFPISYLEALTRMQSNHQMVKHMNGQSTYEFNSEVQKQNRLIKFIRSVEMIFKKEKLCENLNMKNALIEQVIYVLKMMIDDEQIVDMAIYSLQIILNAIGIKFTTRFLDRFLSIAVHAYQKFSHLRKIKTYTKKIFEFYLSDKFNHSQGRFADLQFIFLNKIQENQSMMKSVQVVHSELYSTDAKIQENLIRLVENLKVSSEDIRVLSAQYILELLECKDKNNAVRRVLVSEKILKIVYISIIDLKQDYTTKLNVDFSVFCGKIIAAIGLQHSFVNDTVRLKARNQKTIVGHSEELERNQKQVNLASDYYNPITNQANNVKKRDDVIEILAVPNLARIRLSRVDSIVLASEIQATIRELTKLSDDLPKNYFYSQFLLDKFIGEKELEILTQGDPRPEHEDKIQQLQESKEINEIYYKSISKFVNLDTSRHKDLEYNHKKSFDQIMQKLCYYLIQQMEEKDWQQVFKACIPAIKQSTEILKVLLPYITYYSLRFSQNHDLTSKITGYFNKILVSGSFSNIDQILKTLDFLTIAIEQDKVQFKEFLEEETKFKYVEKLFLLDIEQSRQNDENILTFIAKLQAFPHMKFTFLLVKKYMKFKQDISQDSKFKGAQKIKNYKRCIQFYEDDFRGKIQQSRNNGKDFLQILPSNETIEIVKMYKDVNQQDFNNGFFNSISQSDESMQGAYQNMKLKNQIDDPMTGNEKIDRQKQVRDTVNKFMDSKVVVKYLKERKFQNLREWFGDFDLMEINQSILFDVFSDQTHSSFEVLLCMIFAEYSKGLQFMLKSDDNMDNKQYLDSLKKIKYFTNQIYQYLMIFLADDKEESFNLKLFLHVLYEIDSSIYYLKDMFFSQKEQITEIICKDVHKDRRKFEKIYYEFDMKIPFEYLLTWFENRSQSNNPITSYNALSMIYLVRKLIFSVYDRDNEVAIYQMKIAKLERKNSNDVLKVNQLFKECELNKHRIIDFEYEYAKFVLKFKNAHDSYKYLTSKLDEIKQKCEKMQKEHFVIWVPQKIFEKCMLLSIELQIRIDPRNHNIQSQFSKFVKDLGKISWEKPFFKFAKYLDMLDTPAIGITQPPQNLSDDEKKKRNIQKIFYYMRSLEAGHKYIWQSLPRALELWFDYQDDQADDSKIQSFMKQQLTKLDNFKVATALQILLSRYSHRNAKVRDTIQDVLAKLSCAYPGQSAWWIFHYLYFDDQQKKNNRRRDDVSRCEFAKELINKIAAKNVDTSKKILEGEKIFFELKKLSEKQPGKNDSTMDMPQHLQRVQKSNLVMPIEENLSVQLPPKNYKKNYMLTSLVCTDGEIFEFDSKNSKIEEYMDQVANERANIKDDDGENSETYGYPAYKDDPVLLNGFTPKLTIMHSKEKPKKIGIIGSDGLTYNFLLKWDKHGDLRKEQRFIDFAVLCNKMLENDAESRKRNLRLRTYAIVPLSRNSGLIEWIQNTQTLKTVVGACWKNNNIKGEMSDIKRKAQEAQKGDTHTQIWGQLKQDMKPVLGNWFQDHFYTPEIWYEAKTNFIRSTAIWSMIGYVIGLGDRHGDNILIHSHTGEVTHVDFDCIFEKGAKLRVPEIVPFRLTTNIVDAFGIFQEKGVFSRTCEVVMRVLRKNSSNIQSFLYQFIHDPLIEAQNNVKVEIKEGLSTVEKKLNGHLSNSDSKASATIEEQVEQVILNAINDESLKQMYIGWMPWL